MDTKVNTSDPLVSHDSDSESHPCSDIERNSNNNNFIGEQPSPPMVLLNPTSYSLLSRSPPGNSSFNQIPPVQDNVHPWPLDSASHSPTSFQPEARSPVLSSPFLLSALRSEYRPFRNRKPNYSDEEKRIFFTLLIPHIGTIETKSQDRHIMNIKSQIWKDVTKMYNEIITNLSKNYVRRDSEELKTFWKNTRRIDRKRAMAGTFVSDGEGGSGDGLPAGPSMAESSPNFLTCAPLLASMSGLQHGSRLSGTDDDDSRHHPDVKPDVPLLIDDVDEGESHLNNQASGEESSMPSPPSQGLSGPYLLKKETHCTTILDQLLKDQDYADVTLTAEGRSIFAHKMVLCLASSYFRQVLAKDSNVRSVIVFRDIKFAELKNIINFVYTGEATVDAADLESFMKTAESLEISSLCENEKTVPQQLRSSPSKEPARSSAPETDKPTRIAAKSPMRLSVGLPPQKRKLNNQSPSKRSKHQARFQPVSPTPGPDLSLVKPEPDGVFECEEPEIGCSPPASPRRTQDPPLALTGPDKAPPGRCPFCTASSEFYEGTAIQNHLRTNHPDKTAFPCVACARVFLKKGLFEVHKADCVR